MALARGNGEPAGTQRHFGLVVEDKDAVRARLQELGLSHDGGRRLRLHDPWGNVVEIVDYRDVQYAKRPEVLEAMRADDPGKREQALGELGREGRRRGRVPARRAVTPRTASDLTGPAPLARLRVAY